MKILFVAAEVGPFVTVGGLSQVLYFLPKALKELGHDVRIFTPKYGAMYKTPNAEKKWKLAMELSHLAVPINTHIDKTKTDAENYLYCNVKSFTSGKFPKVYFLENREYYELRANVFGYADDHTRFALLSRGCLEWLLALKKKQSKEEWFPDVIHCNDWHASFILEMARRDKRYRDFFTKTALSLTVHNFHFQGNMDFRYLDEKDKDDGSSEIAPLNSPKLQKQNALLRGILYADAINTVSPTHAIEVLTQEYAEGLDKTLEKVRGKLTGILNGLDTKEFNPAKDTIIKEKFSEKNFIKARIANKLDLQQRFLLPQDEKKAVIAISGRVSSQKGWDMMFEALPHLLEQRPDLQLVVLGNGDDNYRQKLIQLKERFSHQIGLHLLADFRLPRKIFAGADMILMPSLFEPGGIVALEALRYGCVPIVRRTGGLNDIVQDFNPNTKKGNGFSFPNKDAWSLYGIIVEALTIYNQKPLWYTLVANCLASNYSWKNVATEYVDWYKKTIEEKKRATSSTPHPAYNPIALD